MLVDSSTPHSGTVKNVMYSPHDSDSSLTPTSNHLTANSFVVRFPKDGGAFEGGILNGKFHGHGEYSIANSGRYSGEFRAGLRHGLGTSEDECWPGHVYVGEWNENRRHGYGIELYFNDDGSFREEYYGEFVDHKRHGHGVLTTAEGVESHTVHWMGSRLIL